VAERPAGGEKQRRRIGRRVEEASDRWDRPGREKRREGRSGWERKGMGRLLGLAGRGEREVAGQAWPTRGKGRGRGCWASGGLGQGRVGLALSFPFFFLFLSYTQTFKPCHLNSNKFEFKPNTIKIMHQHECTIKLIL
jgi:hypothetical protein